MNSQDMNEGFRDLLATLISDHGQDGGMSKEGRVRALGIAKALQDAFVQAEKVNDNLEANDPKYKRGFEAAIEEVSKWHASETDRFADAIKGANDKYTKLVITTKLATHKQCAEMVRAFVDVDETPNERMMP